MRTIGSLGRRRALGGRLDAVGKEHSEAVEDGLLHDAWSEVMGHLYGSGNTRSKVSESRERNGASFQ